MRRLRNMVRDGDGAAAVEMALVAPLLLVLMFGSVELGNLFMDQHALEKQVRDGARFGARLPLSATYSCSADPSTVFQDADAATQITNVTEKGAVAGAGFPRWGSGYWARNCTGATQTVTVTVRCVDKSDIDTDNTGKTGVYTTLNGAIPVVVVSGAVKYRSVLGSLGFPSANICVRAQSEAAVVGL
jgi:Flp pilus assembly protein TadG